MSIHVVSPLSEKKVFTPVTRPQEQHLLFIWIGLKSCLINDRENLFKVPGNIAMVSLLGLAFPLKEITVS